MYIWGKKIYIHRYYTYNLKLNALDSYVYTRNVCATVTNLQITTESPRKVWEYKHSRYTLYLYNNKIKMMNYNTKHWNIFYINYLYIYMQYIIYYKVMICIRQTPHIIMGAIWRMKKNIDTDTHVIYIRYT